MLAYLAVRGEARRDELVDLLWGDMPEAKARNAFRQALHRLRSALGEEVVPLDREQVRLLADQVSVDRNEFLGAVEEGRWLDAASAYRGDFLEGVELGESRFDEWADAERSRLRSHLQRTLHDAGRAAFEGGRWTEALAATRRLVDASPFDEEAALLEAGIHVAAGRASAGAETLRAFARRLQTELGDPLPARSRDMLARIERTGTRGEPATPPKGSAAQGEGAAPASGFVGREAELARLVAMARAIQEEQGGTLLIVGERGAGKTRLLDETVRRARAFGPVLVLRGRERAGGGAIPYASLAEALRGALRAAGISGASQHLLSEAARLLPELRDMFSLPPLPPVADDTTRVRFFEGVAALVDAVAYERPAVLVLDDLHNASTSTIDLLAYLVARLQGSPVLFLCAARADAAEVLSARLDDAGAARIDLPSLSPDETRALLSELLPAESGLASRIEQIAEASAGLPMRAIELARRVAAGEAIALPPAPVRDILFSRLQACTPSQRRVFFAVALLPRSAPLQLLAAAAHLPEAATFDAALALERQGFVTQTDAGFVLAHDFTAAFVVEQSGPAGRALLAGWAADALAHQGGGDAELAHLYAVAGRASEASSHARRAALGAAAAGARDEAHRLLLQALTFATDPADAAEIHTLLEALGHGRRRLPGVPSTPEDGAAVVPPAPPPDGAPVRAEAPPSPARPPRARLLGIRKSIWLAGAATVVALLYLTAMRTRQARDGGRLTADTLLVARRGRDRAGTAEFVTGDIARTLIPPSGEITVRHTPAWADSVQIPWINAHPSPDGRWVAVERVTRTGTSLYVIGADRRDTAAVASGGGSDIALGWAPDSRALLVSRARALPDRSFDADLYAYSIESRALAPLDTSSARAVSEAAWSPDGSHIAWVARVGATRQQDVFVSRADGAGLQNVSSHRAEDYHIAWSSDGGLIGFTSEREGNAELYAYELGAAHLWRLTNDPAHDDRITFAPDGQHVAFESTRGGQAGVYLMPTLGGTTRRVDAGSEPLAIIGWRGRPTPYLERLRIVGGSGLRQGDTLSLGLVALDQTGAPFALRDVEWSLQDSGQVRLVPQGADSSSLHRRIVGVRDGFASIVASIPGWRSDTLAVRVGSGSLELLSDDFARGIDSGRWQSLGAPAPKAARLAGVPVLVPSGDLEWESGVLSRALLPVQPGMSVQARLFAPFGARTLPNSSVTLALVAPPESRADSIAPQLVPRVSLVWNGESGRLTYAVERESRSEPAGNLGGAPSHLARVVIERDARVAFYVDGRLRWRSTLRLTGMSSDVRARLWIASRATDGWAAVTGVKVIVEE